VDFIHMALDVVAVQWRTLVNKVLKLRVPQNAQNSSSWATISFSWRTHSLLIQWVGFLLCELTISSATMKTMCGEEASVGVRSRSTRQHFTLSMAVAALLSLTILSLSLSTLCCHPSRGSMYNRAVGRCWQAQSSFCNLHTVSTCFPTFTATYSTLALSKTVTDSETK
jgi:hypothetical protein